jgi:hypothetical protein
MCEAIKPKVKKTESITKGLIGTCYFAHNFFMILHPHIGESQFTTYKQYKFHLAKTSSLNSILKSIWRKTHYFNAHVYNSWGGCTKLPPIKFKRSSVCFFVFYLEKRKYGNTTSNQKCAKVLWYSVVDSIHNGSSKHHCHKTNPRNPRWDLILHSHKLLIISYAIVDNPCFTWFYTKTMSSMR